MLAIILARLSDVPKKKTIFNTTLNSERCNRENAAAFIAVIFLNLFTPGDGPLNWIRIRACFEVQKKGFFVMTYAFRFFPWFLRNFDRERDEQTNSEQRCLNKRDKRQKRGRFPSNAGNPGLLTDRLRTPTYESKLSYHR